MSIFTGAGVAIITPFNEDGSINFEEFGKIIEDQIAGHTDAIIVCGTTGESSTMDDDEHLATIKYCVEKVAGRIPVIAGTGSNCTRESINLSKKAEEIGVDGLLCVTPYYNKATQAGLYEYYKDYFRCCKYSYYYVQCSFKNRYKNILPETAVKIAKGS